MFKVSFQMYVFESDHRDESARFAMLYREETLPFAPVPGQEVSWPLESVKKILTSVWIVEHQSFRCRLDDVYTVDHQIDSLDFNEALERAPLDGWAIGTVFPRQSN